MTDPRELSWVLKKDDDVERFGDEFLVGADTFRRLLAHAESGFIAMTLAWLLGIVCGVLLAMLVR